jgi:hypothetical protein
MTIMAQLGADTIAYCVKLSLGVSTSNHLIASSCRGWPLSSAQRVQFCAPGALAQV